jgi:hypothetical protein
MRLGPLAVAAVVLLARPARADSPEPRRLELGASIGWASPIGSAERGARIRDTTTGLVPFELDAAYRLTRHVGVALAARYGAGIPTLCQTASDCESSLGTDVLVAARARFFLPDVGPFDPRLDVGVGYEWLTTRFSDAGVGSSRGYRGPVHLSAELFVPFTLGRRFTLGPALGATLGAFTASSLDTPAGSSSSSTVEHALHGWLSLAVRVSASL